MSSNSCHTFQLTHAKTSVFSCLSANISSRSSTSQSCTYGIMQITCSVAVTETAENVTVAVEGWNRCEFIFHTCLFLRNPGSEIWIALLGGRRRNTGWAAHTILYYNFIITTLRYSLTTFLCC